MAVPERKEEVVAASVDSCDCNHYRLHCDRHIHRARPFHLFSFLIMTQRNYKAKETMLVITVGFLILHLLFHTRLWLYLAAVTGITGVLSFYLSTKIDWLWTKLSIILGEISNHILLTITFFVVVTPVALLRKLFGKKNILSNTKKQSGYFSTRNHLYKKEDFEKSW